MEYVEDLVMEQEEDYSKKDPLWGNGTYLGLDISESSTGLCLYENGTRFTSSFQVGYDSRSKFSECLARRSLKKELLSYIRGRHFDVIVVEDVFQGINPKTTRLLYALNTAIDELILDGLVYCEDFVRVDNKTWKSWLFSLDVKKKYKGLNDKVRIQKCLEEVGITEKGKGAQDRLDATGMVLGYLLQGVQSDNCSKKEPVNVSFSDLYYAYDTETCFIYDEVGEPRPEIVFIDEERFTKKRILKYISEDPSKLYITSKPVRLGYLTGLLNLPLLDGNGYFAFWVKPNRLHLYL